MLKEKVPVELDYLAVGHYCYLGVPEMVHELAKPKPKTDALKDARASANP